MGNQQQGMRAIQCKVLRCEYLPVSTFADNLNFEIIDSTSSRDWVCRSHRRCILVVFAMACEDTEKENVHEPYVQIVLGKTKGMQSSSTLPQNKPEGHDCLASYFFRTELIDSLSMCCEELATCSGCSPPSTELPFKAPHLFVCFVAS